MDTMTDALTPDDIGLGFVAQPVPDLEIATIGDEKIVVGGTTQLVVLNPTAALIFQLFDGETSLQELVDDFTEVLGLDRSVVEDDVLAFVRELGAKGLLAGVALPEAELPEWMVIESSTQFEPGHELDDFTLPDLDGAERSLSDTRGTRTLLVNWSPGCGYCVTIAEELAALHPLLLEHDAELVFVSSGDADANRAVFDPVGLAAPTLLRAGSDVDPFRGTGTPAAYLLDEDGRLVEPMVVGANQVPTLARDLAGVDPAISYVAAVETDAEVDGDQAASARGRYLPTPGAMCGPGGSGTANSTDWQGTRAYALGAYHVGLRYDADDTADVLDRLLAGAGITDPRVPDNYSIALGGTPTTKSAGASRALKLLVHGSTQLVRSRSGGRVLAALLQYLSADVAPADPQLTRVRATALLHGHDALLLPPDLVDFTKELQPRLARAGVRIVDVRSPLLDLATHELVIPEPTIPHDPTVITELDEQARLGRELARPRPGRYPLRAWCFSRTPDQRGPLSPAVAATSALSSVVDRGDDLVSTVERMGGLFAAVQPRGIWYDSADDLVDQVRAALA